MMPAVDSSSTSSFKALRSTLSQAPGRAPGYVVVGYEIEIEGWLSMSSAKRQEVADLVEDASEFALQRRVKPTWSDRGVKLVAEMKIETAMLFGGWVGVNDPLVLGGAKEDDKSVRVLARLTQHALNAEDEREAARK